jgi:hypothetical protein
LEGAYANPSRDLEETCVGLKGGEVARPSQQLVLFRALRGLSPEVMEALLSHIHGAPMLLAALAYGCGVSLSSLRHIRLRDLHLGIRGIDIRGRRYAVPTSLTEDLREYIHERVCGSDATVGVFRRDQPLFSQESFEALRQHAESCISQGIFDWLDPECAKLFADAVSERFLETCLLALSRKHARQIAVREKIERAPRKRAQKGDVITTGSPLELFEKGPKIVRRDRAGSINAYYLWRVLPQLPSPQIS